VPSPATLLPRRADWTVAVPRRDLTAGLTVAVVALPLALGFGVSSGLGAGAGLVTAVVAGALAAVFGGSRTQVSGPTGAMTVVIAPIAATHGPGGILTVGLLAGVLLVVGALCRVGGLMRLVPAPVVEGFTLGIACVIALQQVPAALGLPPGEGQVLGAALHSVTAFVAAPHWTELLLALGVGGAVLLGSRRRPGLPYPLLAVAAATLLTALLPIPSRAIGVMPTGLPAPSAAFFDAATVSTLLPAACAVAALAALESLLSAQVADGMSVSDRHDPDRELLGQGLANLVAPLFGGVPATGAIARTAVNVRAGARSRLAALTHAAVLAAVAYLAAPLVALVPLAALAGVLLATTVTMVSPRSLASMVRATRRDGAVLVLTAAATVALDLTWAIAIGLLVAGALALRSVAREAGSAPTGIDVAADAQERALLNRHVLAYRLDGPLFFAAAHRFLLELPTLVDVEIVILRLSRVSTIDASGALALKDMITELERHGVAVYLSGVRDDHHRPLRSLDVTTRLDGLGRVFATTPDAIAAALRHLTQQSDDGAAGETPDHGPSCGG
jgi:SulP family sulfate permease